MKDISFPTFTYYTQDFGGAEAREWVCFLFSSGGGGGERKKTKFQQQLDEKVTQKL